MKRTALRIFAFAMAPVLASCSGSRPPEEILRQVDHSMAPPERYIDAVSRFGTMLRGYPCALTDTVPIQVQPIENSSGVTDGLPTDLAPVLRGLLAKIGRPVEVLDFDREELLHTDLPMVYHKQLDHVTMERRIPLISVRGSITEGETRLRKGRGWELDVLIPVGEDSESIVTHPQGSVTTIQRDKEVDFGWSSDREVEVTTLAIDLQLYDYRSMTALDRLAESYRINVVRYDRSFAFGIFFEGSGLGYRSRVVGIQSKSRALRMASEVALIHLLGRYFRLPWWRILEGVETDEELVRWYREALEEPDAAGKLKLLLYAHGYDANLGVAELTQEEIDLSLRLKEQLGMDPYAQNDYEFITRLWETVPFEKTERRMEAVRKQWQEEIRKARLAAAPARPVAPAAADPPANAPTPADGPPAVAAPAPSRLRYPTVAKCCPFRFDPVDELPASEGR